MDRDDVGVFRAAVTAEVPIRDVGPHVTVRASGEIDVATTPGLEAALDQAITEHATVVVDLGAVGFLGSSGIGALVRARQRLRAVDRELFVRNAGAPIRRTLSLCGLSDLLLEDAPDLE